MAIITTNYDDLVEQALAKYEVPFDLFVIAIDRNDANALTHGTMLYRHAGEDKLKPVTGETQILDVEIANDEIRLRRTVVFKIHGRHCQVNRCGDVCGRSEGDSEPSRCLIEAGLLSPSPERLCANASIAGGGHEMAPRPEMTVDHRVRGQEPLCLAG